MTEYPELRLAYITQQGRIYVLNLDDGENFARFEITEAQLSNIVADGAEMLLRYARAE